MSSHCHRLICVLILLLGIGQNITAQTVDDARKYFKTGQYTTAVRYYKSLIRDYKYMGYSTADLEQELENAEKCQSLLSSANSLARHQKYSQAIEKYKQIKKHNASDPNMVRKIKECERLRKEYLEQEAIEADWSRCQGITDYRAFRIKHPNSKYDQLAQERIKELERRDDEAAWRRAKDANTISAYESYLRNYWIHSSDAKRKLGDIYESQAMQYYKQEQFRAAKNSYEQAKKYKRLSDQSFVYDICCEEVAFEDLKSNSEKDSINIKNFLSLYPNSKHTQIVNGYLLEYYCFNAHMFDEAREYAKEHPAAWSDGVLHERRWWYKHINEAEKQYKKEQQLSIRKSRKAYAKRLAEHNRSVNKHNGGVEFMYGLGANYGFSGFSDCSYVGLEGVASLGSFSNRINVEISFRFCREVESFGASSFRPSVTYLCPISLSSRLNICKAQGSEDFVFYIQPEAGYAIGASWFYGGRIGLGVSEVGSLYIDYIRSFGPEYHDSRYGFNSLLFSAGLLFYIPH